MPVSYIVDYLKRRTPSDTEFYLNFQNRDFTRSAQTRKSFWMVDVLMYNSSAEFSSFIYSSVRRRRLSKYWTRSSGKVWITPCCSSIEISCKKLWIDRSSLIFSSYPVPRTDLTVAPCLESRLSNSFISLLIVLD